MLTGEDGAAITYYYDMNHTRDGSGAFAEFVLGAGGGPASALDHITPAGTMVGMVQTQFSGGAPVTGAPIYYFQTVDPLIRPIQGDPNWGKLHATFPLVASELQVRLGVCSAMHPCVVLHVTKIPWPCAVLSL